jgi:alkanesulfonate monooxygenase SsuD/methylene tetrahydromethanopterin reductase-like flavin-dependent oxidoreductase (luciferase family)
MIGGGGEQRTLRLVAAYADMWNGFGDLPTIRRKLEVLEDHCRDVGRDPAEIVKTRLGTLLMAPPWTRPSGAWRRGTSGAAAVHSDLRGSRDRRRAGADFLDAGLAVAKTRIVDLRTPAEGFDWG